MLYKKLKIVVLKERKITLDFRRILYIKEKDDYLYDFPVCDKKCKLNYYFTCSELRRTCCDIFNHKTLNFKYVV